MDSPAFLSDTQSMKRVLTAVMLALSIIGATPAHARCARNPKAGSDTFNSDVRSWKGIIVVGTIAKRVPPDAHADWSIYLRVHRYLGTGYLVTTERDLIEITSYGDGDYVVGSRKPGASREESRAFLDRYAGEEAIFFAGLERSRYDPGYRTSSCTYNTIGSADVRRMVGFVLAALEDEPDHLPATGGPTTIALLGGAIAASGVLCRSIGLHVARRRKDRDQERQPRCSSVGLGGLEPPTS